MNTSGLTQLDIARLWALALAKDRHLLAWANRYYGRPLAIQIGADMRRPPNDQDAPFVTIFTDSGQTGPQRAERTSEIGLVAGVSEDEFDLVGAIKEMRGLARLNELCPMLEQAMRLALPRARMQEINTEFEIMQYPLCMAIMSITVSESLPVGRR